MSSGASSPKIVSNNTNSFVAEPNFKYGQKFVLVRNLSQVDFWSFYSKLPYPLPKRKDLGNVHSDDVWMQKIGPALVESDDYLAAKLAIPLSTIFDDKS